MKTYIYVFVTFILSHSALAQQSNVTNADAEVIVCVASFSPTCKTSIGIGQGRFQLDSASVQIRKELSLDIPDSIRKNNDQFPETMRQRLIIARVSGHFESKKGRPVFVITAFSAIGEQG